MKSNPPASLIPFHSLIISRGREEVLQRWRTNDFHSFSSLKNLVYQERVKKRETERGRERELEGRALFTILQACEHRENLGR